ncbi:MAG: dipeptidyl aminopeptidase/acylaminoacyl peptidase, partial [Parvicella sp.]
MRKIIKILTVIFLANSMACSNSQNTKLNAESNSVVVISYKYIEFKSQEVTLRGRLYLPDDKSEKRPVVIMAHGFTTTINGMTADKYAEKFHEAGFAVLLYDHRNLGISDGQPRQELNFWVQSRGYIDAIGLISNQPEIDVDKIAVWGASLSSR